MAVPEFQAFFRPVLGLALEEEVSKQTCIERIPKLLQLTSEDLEERTRSGRITRVVDRVNWAITHMVQAGVLERPRRAVIKATNRGRKLYRANPNRIDMAVLQQFPEYQAFREGTRIRPLATKSTSVRKDQDKEEDETPQERIETAAEEMNAALRGELLSRILNASPTFFEHLIIELMLAMGYGGPGLDKHLGKTADGGVDGVINQDKLGLDAIFLQAKRYAPENLVSVDQIRSFAGALDEQNAVKGVFVTTSSFAGPARAYSERSPKSLVLIDGRELTRLLIDHDVGVRRLQTVELKRLDEDFFTDTV